MAEFLWRLLAVTLVVTFVALVWMTREVLLVLFGAVLFGVFLCGVTNLVMRQTRWHRTLVLSLILVALSAVAILGLWFLGRQILQQFGELRAGLTSAFQNVQARLAESPLADLLPTADAAARPSAAQLTAFAGYVTTGIGALAVPLIMVVAGVFLAVDPDLYRRGLLLLVPPRQRSRAHDILQQAGEALWGWLWGRLFSMSLIGVSTFIGLWLLGMPLALSLALIAFFTNFIPYVGPLLSAVPAVLIALSLGPMQAVYVVLLYSGIQLVETNVITPLVEQHAVNLPPVFTLGAQMISGLLLGPLGIVFATPLAAVIVILVKTIYIESVLGDRLDNNDAPALNRAASARRSSTP